MFKLSSMVPTTLSTYLSKSKTSRKPDPPNLEEISIPLSTRVHMNYQSTDGRYGVNPLTAFGSLSLTPTPHSGRGEKSIARANTNTQEMYRSELYDCMWRIRGHLRPRKPGGGETELLPLDHTYLNSNRLHSQVPDNIVRGLPVSIPGLHASQCKYDGSIDRPLSLGTNGGKAELLNTAIDFTHPQTSVVRSSDEVGEWRLHLDRTRCEDISTVLKNVLDDGTRKTLSKLTSGAGAEYRLDRITWEGRGWEEGTRHKIRRRTGRISVDANWVWKRVRSDNDLSLGLDD